MYYRALIYLAVCVYYVMTSSHSVEQHVCKMGRYTKAELADIHMINGVAYGNGLLAARMYRDTFPNRLVPCQRFFYKFARETGSLRPNQKPVNVRPP